MTRLPLPFIPASPEWTTWWLHCSTNTRSVRSGTSTTRSSSTLRSIRVLHAAGPGPNKTEAIAKYAASKGLTHVGVIYDTLPTDTVTYSDFQTAAKDQGVTITKAVQVPLTAVDASTQVSEMEASGAQAVYVLAVGAQAAIFEALQTQGWSKPVLTEIGAVTPAYATLGPVASKTEFSCGQAVPAGYQLTQEMTEIASIGKANSPGNPFYAYNGAVPNEQVLLLMYAMEKYHSTSYDAIMNAINGAQNLTLSSPLWKYTFSPTQHDGYSQDQEHMCSASAQPIDGYPVIAELFRLLMSRERRK